MLKKKELLEQLRGKVKLFKKEMDSAVELDEYLFAKGKWFVASDLEREIHSGAFDATPSNNIESPKPDLKPRDIVRHPRAAREKLAGRETVIERAKADVAELERTRREGVPHVEDGRLCDYRPKSDGGWDTIHYEVNREKRTVIALISDDAGVWARGIAKCAPDDVFNIWIGKAISLRRALGLDVPDEYVNAPQPTEAQVGDIVEWKSAIRGWVPTTLMERLRSADSGDCGKAFLHSDMGGWIGEKQFRIIDDSRCESADLQVRLEN